MLLWIIMLVMAILLIVTLPAWPYSRRWGYVPSGFLATSLFLILIALLLI